MSLECHHIDGNNMLAVYIQEAEKMIEKCQEMQDINGMAKLARNLAAELKFLKSMEKKKGQVIESHLKSTNLIHFAGLLHAIQVSPGITHVLRPFHLKDTSDDLIVDIIASHGKMWVKVIARKAQALHLIWAGQGQFGERDIVKQADDYLLFASKHPVDFQTPIVHFIFYSQVTYPMAVALEDKGIRVWGQRVPVDPCVEKKLQFNDDDNEEEQEDDDDGDDDDDDNNDDDKNVKKGVSKTVNKYYDTDVKTDSCDIVQSNKDNTPEKCTCKSKKDKSCHKKVDTGSHNGNSNDHGINAEEMTCNDTCSERICLPTPMENDGAIIHSAKGNKMPAINQVLPENGQCLDRMGKDLCIIPQLNSLTPGESEISEVSTREENLSSVSSAACTGEGTNNGRKSEHICSNFPLPNVTNTQSTKLLPANDIRSQTEVSTIKTHRSNCEICFGFKSRKSCMVDPSCEALYLQTARRQTNIYDSVTDHKLQEWHLFVREQHQNAVERGIKHAETFEENPYAFDDSCTVGISKENKLPNNGFEILSKSQTTKPIHAKNTKETFSFASSKITIPCQELCDRKNEIKPQESSPKYVHCNVLIHSNEPDLLETSQIDSDVHWQVPKGKSNQVTCKMPVSFSDKLDDFDCSSQEETSKIANSKVSHQVNINQDGKTQRNCKKTDTCTCLLSSARCPGQSLHLSSTESPKFISCLLRSVPELNLWHSGSAQDDLEENAGLLRKKVNLDITTLITLVSQMCHGGCNLVFKEKILTQQAAEERENPVYPKIKKYLEGKEMFICQTVLEDFQTILSTIGGPKEKQRAKDLLSQIQVVPDHVSEKAKNLPLMGKIKPRSKIIFGTGDALEAITVTANYKFVQSASQNDVHFAVFLHQPRALTEQKEKGANPI